MKARAPLVALFALFAGGCTVDSLLNQSERQSDKTVDLLCDCTNVFPDRAACEAQFQPLFSLLESDCVEDALKEDKKASRESLKCTVKAQKEYNKCLEDNLDCNDQTSIQTCQPLLVNDCPELPQPVQTAISACSPLEIEFE